MSDEKPRNRQLGRGLSALLGAEPVNIPRPGTTRDDLSSSPAEKKAPEPAPLAGPGATSAPTEFLAPSPLQPRRNFAQDEIAELAESIRQRGILQPILVRHDPANPDRYEIVAGERRWRAAQAAQLHEVPILIKDLDDEGVLEVAIVENVQRQDLNSLEEAAGYRRLIDQFSHTQDSLAGVVGKSRSHIANTLRLLTLPDAVRNYLDSGELTAGHARALIGLDDAGALARKVVKAGMSVRQTERLVRRAKDGKKPKPMPPEKDPDTVALENSLSDLLGLRVVIDFNGRGGALTVRYTSLDQLDELITRLSQPLPT
ncbi:MAG: ParB/RepB/Spo0J family partition protein [Alphaproteobacteria bacterium]